MCRRDKFDRAESRRQDDDTTTMLSDTVIRTIDYTLWGIFGEIESFVRECVEEVVKNRMPPDVGNVLHGDDVRLQLTNEPCKFREKRPFRITLFV